MRRRSTHSKWPVSAIRVGATALAPTDNWHVSMEIGDPATGSLTRYLTTQEARALAAELTAAADHYDAETTRLAGADASTGGA